VSRGKLLAYLNPFVTDEENLSQLQGGLKPKPTLAQPRRVVDRSDLQMLLPFTTDSA
jgi:hypothetical protein